MQGRGVSSQAVRLPAEFRFDGDECEGNFREMYSAARIPGYTVAVEKTKQNVTLVVDEDLLLAARKIALDQRTSVNRLVREYLAKLVEEPSQRRLARAHLRHVFEAGLVDVGERT